MYRLCAPFSTSSTRTSSGSRSSRLSCASDTMSTSHSSMSTPRLRLHTLLMWMSSIFGPCFDVIGSCLTFLNVFATVPDPMSRHSRSLARIRWLPTLAPGILLPISSTGSSSSPSLITACPSSLKCSNSSFFDPNSSSQHPHLVFSLRPSTASTSASSVFCVRGSSGRLSDSLF